MLKTRIIPVLLWDGRQAVKTKQYRKPGRPVGSMMQHILTMQERNVDELILLDINATQERREPDYARIEEFASRLYCPLTVGGGVASAEHIKNLLNSGADKVAIKSNWNLVKRACEKFGAQSIVGAIDVCNVRYVASYMGKLTEFTVGNVPGEVLLTCMDREGTMNGYDLATIEPARRFFGNIPIILNGGCGHPDHMFEAVDAGADAVAASSLFLFTDWTPRACAKYLIERGIDCRYEPNKPAWTPKKKGEEA